MKTATNVEDLPQEIREVIDREVRPALKAHGGDLILTRFKDGVLQFRLSGNCSGCPSAWLTAEEVVKAPLLGRFPALKDVVADNDLEEELVQMARDLLSGKQVLE